MLLSEPSMTKPTQKSAKGSKKGKMSADDQEKKNQIQKLITICEQGIVAVRNLKPRDPT